MLKQVTVLPELGTADPFAAVLIHEVGLGGAGKAVDFGSVLRMCTGAEADPSCWNPRWMQLFRVA